MGSRLDALTQWVVAEGGLPALDPLTRPVRFAALRRAVDAQDTLALSVAGLRAYRWLRDELGAAGDSTVVVAELGAGTWRDGRRESFRAGGSSGSGLSGGIWLHLVRGPLVVVLNPGFDERLKDDPEYTGKIDRFVTGRLQTGYLAVTGRVGDLVAGRMARSWGPSLFPGLQLSPSAYATDQLAGTVRLGRFELTTLAQRLDDVVDTTLPPPVTPVNRWFLAHRLTFNAGHRAWLALSETGVYGGPGRGFEPAFHMPLNLALLTEFNERRQVNLLWGLEGHLRPVRGMALDAQAVIDDIQIHDQQLGDQRPMSGGLTIQASGALPAAPVHATVGYTRVWSLTYRNSFAPYEAYAVSGIGIARNFSDYDQALLRLETRPFVTLHVALDVSYLRQGSGDFRQPFPPDSVLAQPGQGFLVAPVERAGAWRVSATWDGPAGFRLSGQFGRDANVSGPPRTIASIGAAARFDVFTRRSGSPWPAVEFAPGRNVP